MKKCYDNVDVVKIDDSLLNLLEYLEFNNRIFNDRTNNLHVYNNFNNTAVINWFESKKISNVSVPFAPIKAIKNLQDVYSGDSFFEKLNQITTIKNVFDIPIKYKNEPWNYGEFIPLYDKSGSQLYITEINLSKTITNYTPVIYAHEVMHALLERGKNNIFKLENYDVIPMVIERMLVDENNINVGIDNKRLCDLKNAIINLKDSKNELVKIKSSQYIKSILLSRLMYNRYVSYNENKKNEILSMINDIILDKYSAENIMDYMDISFSESISEVIKLKKIKGGKYV